MSPLKQLRRERGLSQGQLARMADVYPGVISLIENGYRPKYDSDRVRAIAAALDVPVRDVLGYDLPGWSELSRHYDERRRARLAPLLERLSPDAPRFVRDLAGTTGRSRDATRALLAYAVSAGYARKGHATRTGIPYFAGPVSAG